MKLSCKSGSWWWGWQGCHGVVVWEEQFQFSVIRCCKFLLGWLGGGDEQKEIAISPLILNVSVAHFLEPIPYMDIHLSTMLECEKSDWFLSEGNISCSLLTTVTSNICQYLNQYWLFLWRFFWHAPIRHRRRDLECQNTNSMYQSATKELGVLTVCHSEHPYLSQNKIFLWRIFRIWFLMIIV